MRTIARVSSISLSIFTVALGGCAAEPLEESAGVARSAVLAPPNTVLILDGAGNGAPQESFLAQQAGFNVEVASAGAWAAKTAADFASYEAVLIGATNCSANVNELAAAVANGATWGPSITGNVIVAGSSPGSTAANGAYNFAVNALLFAASGAGTGAYVSLSCYYHFATPPSQVPVLAPFGTFTVKSPSIQLPFYGYNQAHQVATHPTMAPLTDAILSNWHPSARDLIIGFPAGFQPHVIVTDADPTEPGWMTFPDGPSGMGSRGIPYVVSRGAQQSLCGNGLIDPGEQCDDGNYQSGDGCDEDCQIDPIVCGDGNVDQGEQCDDGNTIDGDGCSSTCQWEIQPSIGACCLSGGGCQEALSPADCEAVGGAYTADDLTCSQVAPECPGLLGACCLPQGGCADQASDAFCQQNGGSFLGTGTTCDNEGAVCAPPPDDGACCLPDGSCVDPISAFKCEANHGTYLGDGTSCATYGAECKAEETGACCVGGGCAEMTATQCEAQGGTFAGPGSVCDETTCPGCTEPIGACCVDQQCLMLSETACFANGGLYAGDGSVCTSDTCSCDGPNGCCDEIAQGCSTTAQGTSGGGSLFALVAAALSLGLASRRRRAKAKR
jgi:cysteine-rich repeat protein